MNYITLLSVHSFVRMQENSLIIYTNDDAKITYSLHKLLNKRIVYLSNGHIYASRIE